MADNTISNPIGAGAAATVPAAAATNSTGAAPKAPGKFGRVFGGILGGALNTIAPASAASSAISSPATSRRAR